MLKPDIAARYIRDAEWQLTHGNPKGALVLYKRLFEEGCTEQRAFDRYRQLHREINGTDLTHEQIFDFVYTAGLWGVDPQTRQGISGWGSLEATTGPYRQYVESFLTERNIATVVEIGCGDWQIGRAMDWHGADYLGIDVSQVVLQNTRKYAGAHVRFMEGDARTIELPPADLLLAKDVLQHWSNADVLAFLPKLARYRFALITNGHNPDLPRRPNMDIRVGDYREMDLALPPFNVRGALVFSYDTVAGNGESVVLRDRKRVFLIGNDGRRP